MLWNSQTREQTPICWGPRAEDQRARRWWEDFNRMQAVRRHFGPGWDGTPFREEMADLAAQHSHQEAQQRHAPEDEAPGRPLRF